VKLKQRVGAPAGAGLLAVRATGLAGEREPALEHDAAPRGVVRAQRLDGRYERAHLRLGVGVAGRAVPGELHDLKRDRKLIRLGADLRARHVDEKRLVAGDVEHVHPAPQCDRRHLRRHPALHEVGGGRHERLEGGDDRGF